MRPYFVALVVTLAAARVAPAAEVFFSQTRITSLDIARIGVFCLSDANAAGAPEPCAVALHFHDLRGNILKQAEMMLLPDTGGFLDLRFSEMGLTSRQGEIIPCLRVERGIAVGSVELFDAFAFRTRILTSWGDRPTPKSGEVHVG